MFYDVLEKNKKYLNVNFVHKMLALTNNKAKRDNQKVKIGNDQEMAQLARNSHSKNRGGEITQLTLS